ncbi:MAG: hypothetical protein JWM99_2427, partial [Verrucomicrobiales bacterium]|nr:hypothetical protein [Verrucomicrobiales bacterium]
VRVIARRNEEIPLRIKGERSARMAANVTLRSHAQDYFLRGRVQLVAIKNKPADLIFVQVGRRMIQLNPVVFFKLRVECDPHEAILPGRILRTARMEVHI